MIRLNPAFSERRPLRALLIGQALSPGEKGGLSIALDDLADQLRIRGWEVDVPVYSTAAVGEKPDSALKLRATNFSNKLAVLSRWTWAAQLGQMLPVQIRYLVEILFMPRSFWENASTNLYRVEQLLEDSGRYDVVLLSSTVIDAPGLMSLATRRHPRVMLIGLDVLAMELRAWWWSWLRVPVRWRLRRSGHPFLLQRVSPDAIELAVFANRQWYEEAIEAGLAKEKAHIIYFSVPLSKPLPRSSTGRNRLLWVGRLSREKGLHLLLDALPAIRQILGELTLTIIAAQGSAGYRDNILGTIRRNCLDGIVTLRPPVERAALQTAYAEHDLLFFYSPFADPVALVLMEAFAAGLPVVASAAHPHARLVQDRKTCLCYQPGDCRSLVSAVVTMLTDVPLQTQLVRHAQGLVQNEFSPARMGQSYDSLLRRFLAKANR